MSDCVSGVSNRYVDRLNAFMLHRVTHIFELIQIEQEREREKVDLIDGIRFTYAFRWREKCQRYAFFFR